MNDKITLLKLAERILEMEKKPLKQNEIWEKAKDRGLVDPQNYGKTPWDSIGARLYVDIRDNPGTVFFKVPGRPTRFYLKKYRNEPLPEPLPEVGSGSGTVGFSERDLHPLIVRFVYANDHFHSLSLTIYHEVSPKRTRGYNEWLHPDLVGVHFPFDDYDEKVLDAQKELGASRVKLFSFEVKKRLDLSNLRESYFQAVSNSSWAHEGYLVVFDLGRDPEFMDELRRLNNAFGMGIIVLETADVDQSEILLPARIRQELDWDTVNRLYEENENFRKFVNSVKNALRIGTTSGQYDAVLNEEQLQKYLREKNIVTEGQKDL